jgi:hypothetical protein
MIIKCNCGKVLTKDLYYTKDFHVEKEIDDEGHVYMRHYWLHTGAFTTSVRTWYDDKKLLCVSREDFVEGFLLEYQYGWGCCDISHKDVICECGKVIGDYSLDCWQTRTVDLFENCIRREY